MVKIRKTNIAEQHRDIYSTLHRGGEYYTVQFTTTYDTTYFGCYNKSTTKTEQSNLLFRAEYAAHAYAQNIVKIDKISGSDWLAKYIIYPIGYEILKEIGFFYVDDELVDSSDCYIIFCPYDDNKYTKVYYSFTKFIINPTIEKNGAIISSIVQYVITQLKLDKYANIDVSLVSRYTFTKVAQEQIATINEIAKANEDIKALNAAIDRYKQISERNNKILNSFTITETNS
jgi:hypothetical protein